MAKGHVISLFNKEILTPYAPYPLQQFFSPKSSCFKILIKVSEPLRTLVKNNFSSHWTVTGAITYQWAPNCECRHFLWSLLFAPKFIYICSIAAWTVPKLLIISWFRVFPRKEFANCTCDYSMLLLFSLWIGLVILFSSPILGSSVGSERFHRLN